MMRLLLLLAGLVAAATARAELLPSNAWSEVPGPTAGRAEAIGGFAHGCLAGGEALPIDGPGYEAIRLSRKRNFGHPDTVAFVEELGREAQAAGLPLFYVGDMSQARGGPLPYGHASHQIGMDVDIWFTFAGARRLPPGQREQIDLPSMIIPAEATVDPHRFGPHQLTLLRLAAEDRRVERIFVSPAIKLALCHGYGGATAGGSAWLHRLSPWWGHDDHFHVRLHCPADSPACEPQPPVPPGDGCDAGLERWAHHLQPAIEPVPAPARPLPARKLPAACSAVLAQR